MEEFQHTLKIIQLLQQINQPLIHHIIFLNAFQESYNIQSQRSRLIN